MTATCFSERPLKGLKKRAAIVWILLANIPAAAQQSGTQGSAVAQPLPTPVMTGPLQTAPPFTIDAGPFGTLDLTGVLSGLGLVQRNPLPEDKSIHLDLSNGEVFLQKIDGRLQFYVQAGAYDLPALGTAYYATVDTVRDFYQPLPVAYLKLAPTKNISILVGLLPTLLGAEPPFTFQNMDIEHGLLWNQGNVVNRGVQVNDTLGKLTASLSWNDGFYSDRFDWLSGSLSYAWGASNTVAFKAGGNLGQTAFRSLTTPVQNNGRIYDFIYTHAAGPWIIRPYVQYSSIPTNPKAGVVRGAATRSGALLLTYTFPHHFSLSGRGEYISTTGNAGGQAINLLYGPGSGAWSTTLTPTFQDHGFFIRGEFSVVAATRFAAGAAFGPQGMNRNQLRAAMEAGVMF